SPHRAGRSPRRRPSEKREQDDANPLLQAAPWKGRPAGLRVDPALEQRTLEASAQRPGGTPPRLPVRSPQIRDTTNTTRKRKKSTRAISADPEAMPPNPKTAEMIAIMKNTAAQRNMDTSLFGTGRLHKTPAGRSPDDASRYALE